MANKPPAVKITGIRGSIPAGYLLGRVDPGHGPVQLISQAKAQSAGLIPASLPGPPTGAAGGDLSGTYPNPSVAKLQGRAVSAGAPANTNVLAWGGAAWAPLALAAVAYSGAYGDLSGLPAIHNVPAGGTAGQALTKVDGTDYNTTWSTISAGSGGGAASIYDDGSDLYVAVSDTDGQLVLDGSGDPIFVKEVLPPSSLPLASTSAFGGVKVDGTTIIATAGVLSATGPKGSFRTTRNANQTVTANTTQLMVMDTVASNVDGWFNLATNKYTPQVKGTYLFIVSFVVNILDGDIAQTAIGKNGAVVAAGSQYVTGGNGVIVAQSVFLVDCNGTTDYVQPYIYPGAQTAIIGSSSASFFQGVLVAAT